MAVCHHEEAGGRRGDLFLKRVPDMDKIATFPSVARDDRMDSCKFRGCVPIHNDVIIKGERVMKDIREMFMLLDKSKYDRQLLELLDQMIWRMEELDNRLRGTDRLITEMMTQ